MAIQRIFTLNVGSSGPALSRVKTVNWQYPRERAMEGRL
jgi:hypothetical protein